MYKVLIADDEAGIRLLLRKVIEKNNGFVVSGEAADGESAVSLAERLNPDVIFMDVEMPGLNGVECAKRIQDINPKVIIIFATGHEEYMPKAFELYAFDYITKPFNIHRIHQTLNRISSLFEQKENVYSSPLFQNKSGLGKIVIKNKEGISLIDEEDIIFIQRENRSTVIYTSDGQRYVTSEGLSELEERLDKNLFLRSHKSYIINISMVYKIYPYGRWTYVAKLRNTDMDALITHEKYEEIQKRFK